MQVLPTFQPNWILVDNSPNVRLIISEEVVMQPVFHGHNTSGRASVRYPASWFLLLDDPGGGGGEFVNRCEFTLCPVDFAVQFVAFDVGNDFAVEADLVQVSAVVA